MAWIAAHFGKDALTRLAGPSFDVLGKRLAEGLEKRLMTVTQTVQESGRMLNAAGLEPVPTPGRILWPILEHSSLEEDERLRSMWAALLANARSPRREDNEILPGFADILRQLTPQQAEILQWMYYQGDRSAGFTVWPDVDRHAIEERFSLSGENYAVFITDLNRMQLIHPQRLGPFDRFPPRNEDDIRRVLDLLGDRETYHQISLSALGLRFLRAVNPPRAAG